MEKRAKRLQAAYKFSWEDLYKKRVKQRIDEWWERRI